MQELTAIVGRQAEVAQITELLHVQRLVTLVGPGGIGKTRLARAVAASAADRFPGGVFVIELVGSTELGELASLVAGQLGFDSLEGVHYRSIDQAVLVVLDNCESAIHQSARLAADLGDRASALRVLATSRAPLGSPGEYLVPVRPLRVPAVGDLADARSCAAVQLFLERAARAGARLVRERRRRGSGGRTCSAARRYATGDRAGRGPLARPESCTAEIGRASCRERVCLAV